jgi:hypothetical protein
MTTSRVGLALGYAIVAVLAGRAATVVWTECRLQGSGEPVRDLRRLRWLWIVTTGIVLVFGANRAFDTHEWLVGRIRALWSAEGWYAGRRHFQRIVIACLLAFAAVVAVGLGVMFRRSMKRALGVLVGVTFLVSYVAIRLVSLHNVDATFAEGPISIGRVVEWAGLALIAASAVYADRDLRR